MRLFRRENSAPDDRAEGPPVDEADIEPAESISARPLGDPERARIAEGLAFLAEAGVDVDDLASLSTAFDAAVEREDDTMLRPLAVGVGEHLHRHAPMRWAVITDAFGSDLGVEGRRRDLHVVPDSLLSARWMRREKGWLPGVVGHLADVSNR